MRALILSIAILLALQSKVAQVAASDTPIDQSNPVTLIEEMLLAIELGHFELLKPLCDPLGQGDGDSEMICTLSTQPADIQAEYQKFFTEEVIFDPDQTTMGESGISVRSFYELALRAREEGLDDEISELMVEMISDRWLPIPFTVRFTRRSDGKVGFREDKFKVIERLGAFYLLSF